MHSYVIIRQTAMKIKDKKGFVFVALHFVIRACRFIHAQLISQAVRLDRPAYSRYELVFISPGWRSWPGSRGAAPACAS